MPFLSISKETQCFFVYGLSGPSGLDRPAGRPCIDDPGFQSSEPMAIVPLMVEQNQDYYNRNAKSDKQASRKSRKDRAPTFRILRSPVRIPEILEKNEVYEKTGREGSADRVFGNGISQ